VNIPEILESGSQKSHAELRATFADILGETEGQMIKFIPLADDNYTPFSGNSRSHRHIDNGVSELCVAVGLDIWIINPSAGVGRAVCHRGGTLSREGCAPMWGAANAISLVCVLSPFVLNPEASSGVQRYTVFQPVHSRGWRAPRPAY